MTVLRRKLLRTPHFSWLALLAAAAACAVAPAKPAAEVATGRDLYFAHCATCHAGQTGLMGQAPPPDLLRDPLPRGDGEAALGASIANGTGSPAMPAFADGLSAAEIEELVRFLEAERMRLR